jgi:cyclin-dependent kinase
MNIKYHGKSYYIIEKIGEGAYGKVYKARDNLTKKVIALKKTRLQIDDEGIPSVILREVSLLYLLNESNYIVKLLTVEYVESIEMPTLYLVFEYLTTDLKQWIESVGRGPFCILSNELIKSITYQLTKGVAHCHRHGVLHRDLKPQNLLVEVNPSTPHLSRLKIADLGLSRIISIPIQSYTQEVVTLWYRAPEVLLGAAHYNLGVDIWSVGCIFAELINNSPLFPGDSEIQQLLFIFMLLGTPRKEIWPDLDNLREWHEFPIWSSSGIDQCFPEFEVAGMELLKKMFIYDSSVRISAKAALSHPYFDDVNKEHFDQPYKLL